MRIPKAANAQYVISKSQIQGPNGTVPQFENNYKANARQVSVIKKANLSKNSLKGREQSSPAKLQGGQASSGLAQDKKLA